MARVFLSYDRDDAALAAPIAAALERAGHDVWWDQHIRGGAQFSREIERALNAADAVIVLWSINSVESAWVRDEAASGRDRGRLIPLALDQTPPPLGFRQYQTISLPGGRMGRAQEQTLQEAIGALTERAELEAASPKKPRAIPRPKQRWLLVALAAASTMAIATLVVWRPWVSRNDIVLSVAAADENATSQSLARALTIKLGALSAASATPLKLVEATDTSVKPFLRVEAAASDRNAATLTVKLARDSSILWSDDLENPSGTQADLVQQLTVTAGRVIGCAMEGLAGPVRLKPPQLKSYLSACAQLSELGALSPTSPSPLLRSVIERSPKFEPAWTALLLTEVEEVSDNAAGGEPDTRALAQLRRDLTRVRDILPDLPAANLAEAALLPATDFAGRMALIEEAAAQSTDNPFILMRLAGAMSDAGRMRDAVTLAKEAAELAPLSPIIHANYIGLLAYSGNFDSAKRELENAKRLWPGTASLEDAQYRFHFRYGDPRIARAIFERNNDVGGRGPRMLLAARENPEPATIEPFLSFVRERLRNMENPSVGLGFATTAFAQFDRKDDVFATLLNWPKAGDLAIMSQVYFRPEFNNVRRDPRFMMVAKRAGLLDYWQKSAEWPDFCFASDKTYDCKGEAAKLQ